MDKRSRPEDLRRNSIKVICGVAILLGLQLVMGQLTFAQADRGVGNRPAAEKRVALVIGNGAYQHTAPLPNPPNDAADMKGALEALGFEVIYGVDQDARQMKTLIRRFGDRLNETKGVGLFFYAGHGVAAAGENFLVPVDADIPQEDEIEGATIPLNFLMSKLDTAKNPLNIVILDACRNNPFARSWGGMRDISSGGGLAEITKAPTGTLIAYATAPGKTASDGNGRNGLYTQELLVQLKEPNQKIEDVFKNVRIQVKQKSNQNQTPWESSSIEGSFYFVGAGGLKSAEDLMWDAKVAASTRGAVEEYLSKYPNGKYAASAQLMLKEFELKADQQKWEEVRRSNTIERFRKYLSLFPNGSHAADAEQTIRELVAREVQPKIGKSLKDSLGIEFTGVPAGTFQSADSMTGAIRTVTISSGLYLGRSEITQGMWKAVMGSFAIDCGKGQLNAKFVGDNKPVVCVTWDEVQEFIAKLNARGEGTYRLPTDAEWDYAARAGRTTEYTYGDEEGALGSYGWYKSNSGGMTHDVATKQPNAWGLYDMHGNASEWVQDWSGSYPVGAVADPKGPPSGTGRVIRGPAWDSPPGASCFTCRGQASPSTRGNHLGFRIVWSGN